MDKKKPHYNAENLYFLHNNIIYVNIIRGAKNKKSDVSKNQKLKWFWYFIDYYKWNLNAEFFDIKELRI